MKQDRALEILKTGKNIFLTGSAGTGKTYLLAKYLKYLKDRKVKISITAPTGIAASHLSGQTLHSFFGLGIRSSIDDYFIDSLLQKKYLHDRMSKLKVLVIDEISMVSPEIFESIDKILRAFKFSNEPFGGIQVIISGDFFQLPPVSKVKKEKNFAFQSHIWSELNLKTCYLEEKFRQEDEVLIKILDEIREGKVSEESMNVFRSRYRRRISNSLRPTKLYTHNVDVDRINENELENIEGKKVFFEAIEKGSKQNIEKIYKTSLVLPKISFKKEAIVIFIKNDHEKGVVNGTIGKVVDFDESSKLPIVEIFSGRKIKAEKKDWILESETGKIKATVSQVPLRLAWAMTIHKSQGMTLDAAEMDLSKTFEKGQGYVALSRLKSIEGLRIMGLNKVALEVSEEVLERDRVFKEESEINDDEYDEQEKEEKKKLEEEFLKKIDAKKVEKKYKKVKNEKGEMEEVELEEEEFDPEKFFHEQAKENSKESTYEKTLKIMRNENNLEKVIEKREVSYDTVIRHLEYLYLEKEDDETFNKFKPEESLLFKVEKAVLEIKNRANEDDFLENGKIKLKSVFELLKDKKFEEKIKKMIKKENKNFENKLFEEITYNDIKLAMIFIK